MMAALRFLSVSSGIEAASVAWEPLGFAPAGYAEIARFPSAVLTYRLGASRPQRLPSPDDAIDDDDRRERAAALRTLPTWPSGNRVTNFGDFTQLDVSRDIAGPVHVLVGGTPCQSFSFAGERLSLADARGNLSLAYAVLAHELARSHGLQFAVWENVPGVLSTPDNAFGCLLGALVGGEPVVLPRGGRWPDAGLVAGPRARAAWRVQDAQYFGLAQRRERVFVVVGFTERADPAAVLFEPAGLHGNPPPRRQARQGTAGDVDAGAAIGGGPDGGRIAGAVTAKWAKGTGGPAGDEAYNLVAFPKNLSGTQCVGSADVAPTLQALNPTAVAYDLRGREGGAQFEGPHDTANLRASSGGSSRSYVVDQWAVRRLTPLECSRLQGFPDDWARVPWRGAQAADCPDGPQYNAYGNSMAVPVMRRIGERIGAVLNTR